MHVCAIVYWELYVPPHLSVGGVGYHYLVNRYDRLSPLHYSPLPCSFSPFLFFLVHSSFLLLKPPCLSFSSPCLYVLPTIESSNLPPFSCLSSLPIALALGLSATVRLSLFYSIQTYLSVRVTKRQPGSYGTPPSPRPLGRQKWLLERKTNICQTINICKFWFQNQCSI